MLLSETAVTPDGTWIAVAFAGVTTLGSVAAGAFALVQFVVNKRYDAKLTTLEMKVDDCEEKHAECEDKHTQTNAELARTKSELEARDRRDRAELEAKIAQLQRENAEERGAKHDFRNELQRMQAQMDAMNLRARLRHGDDAEPKGT